jgi:(R,R)-butanediol dehydrogenase/meso-butanediol dehydrogenase/diacetyl reductase
MLAARLHGRGDLRVDHLPDPAAPPAGWVRLRIDACGICGTDVEEFTAGPVLVPTEPHVLSHRSAPLTLGHEAVGEVIEVGAGVTLAVGTRVAVDGNMFCGECFWCSRREFQLCAKLASLGLMADGGLAEQMLAPAFMCIPYGDHVAPEHAALAEPLSVAVRAIRRARVTTGTTVGIVGAGAVGLLALQVARAAGAETIVCVERHPHRRELALRLGADIAVAPHEAALGADELTGGIGLDVTIEAAGNAEAAASTVRLARRGGRAVLLGVFDDVVPIDMIDFLFGEKEIIASLSHVYDVDFVEAVKLIDSGRIDVAPLISDRISLPDVVTAGFEPLVANSDRHLKVMVFPQASLDLTTAALATEEFAR